MSLPLPFLLQREGRKRNLEEERRRRAQRLAIEAQQRQRRAEESGLSFGEPILSSSPEAEQNRQTILGV